MSLVLAWLNRKTNPSGIHLAADSMLTDLSLNGTVLRRWPYATKIFRVHPTDEHVAYCGSSLRALYAISGAMQLLSNTDVLRCSGDKTPPQLDARVKAIAANLDEVAKRFPPDWGETAKLLYAGFDSRNHTFKLFSITLSQQGVVVHLHDLKATPLLAFGAGAVMICKRIAAFNKPSCAFQYEDIMALLKECIGKGKTVGGVPQGVVVRRVGFTPLGFNVTIDAKETSTLYGIPIAFRSEMSSVHFKDHRMACSRNLRSGKLCLVGTQK